MKLDSSITNVPLWARDSMVASLLEGFACALSCDMNRITAADRVMQTIRAIAGPLRISRYPVYSPSRTILLDEMLDSSLPVTAK